MSTTERKTAVALIVFALILASLGCGTGNQTNSNQTTPTPTSVPSACLIDKPTERATQVQTELYNKLGIGNTGNTMEIEVLAAPDEKDYLVLLVEGSSKGKLKFPDQIQVINAYMVEKCILSVYFVPDGTVSKPGFYLGEDFEWSTCEWPKQPCSDGTCNCF